MQSADTGLLTCISQSHFPPPMYRELSRSMSLPTPGFKSHYYVTLTETVGMQPISRYPDLHCPSNQVSRPLSEHVRTPTSLLFCYLHFHGNFCVFSSDTKSSTDILNMRTYAHTSLKGPLLVSRLCFHSPNAIF